MGERLLVGAPPTTKPQTRCFDNHRPSLITRGLSRQADKCARLRGGASYVQFTRTLRHVHQIELFDRHAYRIVTREQIAALRSSNSATDANQMAPALCRGSSRPRLAELLNRPSRVQV